MYHISFLGKDSLNIVNGIVFLKIFMCRSFFLPKFATSFSFHSMKKIVSVLVCCLCLLGASAQVDKKYGIGTVPVVNGRVTLQRHASVSGVGSQEVFDKTVRWVEGRFVTPGVLKAKIVETDSATQRIVVNAEEYLTFRNTLLVLDRTRINYWLEITAKEDGYDMTMTRIAYWYEEERNGGQRFCAEEWITDDECFNSKKTRLLRSSGKFRIKTIDLIDTLNKELNSKF